MNDYDLDQLGFDELSLLLREAYDRCLYQLVNEITDEMCKRVVESGDVR